MSRLIHTLTVLMKHICIAEFPACTLLPICQPKIRVAHEERDREHRFQRGMVQVFPGQDA